MVFILNKERVSQTVSLWSSVERNMHLDPAIRDWVMMPILLVMILVGLLRSNATLLLQSKPKVDKWLVRESQALLKSARLRNVKILSCRIHGKDDGSFYGLDMVFCLTSFGILNDFRIASEN